MSRERQREREIKIGKREREVKIVERVNEKVSWLNIRSVSKRQRERETNVESACKRVSGFGREKG